MYVHMYVFQEAAITTYRSFHYARVKYLQNYDTRDIRYCNIPKSSVLILLTAPFTVRAARAVWWVSAYICTYVFICIYMYI